VVIYKSSKLKAQSAKLQRKVQNLLNPKFKILNPKQIQMTKIQNSKQNFKIKVLNFEIACPPKFCFAKLGRVNNL